MKKKINSFFFSSFLTSTALYADYERSKPVRGGVGEGGEGEGGRGGLPYKKGRAGVLVGNFEKHP